MAFHLILQLHKKGSGKQSSSSSYTPTPQELKLQDMAVGNAEFMNPFILGAAQKGWDLLNDPNNFGTQSVDYGALAQQAMGNNNAAMGGIQSLQRGELPAAYQQNMQDSIRSGVQNTLGTMVNGMANRGVLNSSVTTAANQSIANSTADAMAKMYNTNIGQLANLYQAQGAMANANIGTSSLAQGAALQPTVALWDLATGLNRGSTLGSLAAMRGGGTTTRTADDGGASAWGALGSLAGAYSATVNHCFSGDAEVLTADEQGGATPKPIREVRPGDYVYGYDPVRKRNAVSRVCAVMRPRQAVVLKITTDKGRSVTASLSQPLLKADGKTWVAACDVRKGFRMAGEAGRVVSVEPAGRTEVYDLKLGGGLNNYIADGFVAKGGTEEW